MYGLSRLLGVGPRVTLCDREFPVRARTLRDYAEIEAEILRLRGNPFDTVRYCCVHGGMGQDFAATLFGKVRDGWWNPTFAESVGWLKGSWQGRAFALWLAIRRAGISREWTESATRREVERCGEFWWRGTQEALDQANGDDELGAIDWLVQKEAKNNSRGIPWAMVFRILAEEPYSFPVETVADMTMRQLRIYYCERESVCGKQAEASEIAGLRALERWQADNRQYAGSLVQGKHWGSE